MTTLEKSDFKKDLLIYLDSIKDLLLLKNKKYGDSALNPKRIFSNQNATEQIKVRIDDKISRIANINGVDDEDTIADLIGYLIILKISIKREKQKNNV